MKSMKRNRFTAILVTALLLSALMPLSVFAATSAQLFDVDQTTGGNWVGTYGSDGYIIMTGDDSLQSIPSYSAVTSEDDAGNSPPSFWQWWATGTDDTTAYTQDEITSREPGALYTDSTKTSRIAACYYSGNYFTVTVDVGSETKIVSLYILDYDQQSRESTITAYDESGKTLSDAVDAYGYDTGWYLKYKISGKVTFEFDMLGGPNAVLSGIFFDSATSAAAAQIGTLPTTAAPTTTPEFTTAAPAATTAVATAAENITAAPAAGGVTGTTASNTKAAPTSGSASSGNSRPILWIIIAVVVVIIIVIIIILATRKKK